jgi:hypothetical protein
VLRIVVIFYFSEKSMRNTKFTRAVNKMVKSTLVLHLAEILKIGEFSNFGCVAFELGD